MEEEGGRIGEYTALFPVLNLQPQALGILDRSPLRLDDPVDPRADGQWVEGTPVRSARAHAPEQERRVREGQAGLSQEAGDLFDGWRLDLCVPCAGGRDQDEKDNRRGALFLEDSQRFPFAREAPTAQSDGDVRDDGHVPAQ